MGKSFFRFITFLIIIFFCSSWGFLVHRTVNQLAIYELPKPMQPFFYRNIKYIVENSVRPDLRRNSDPGEAPKHFIDLEAYGDSAAWKMPMSWNDAVKKYSKDTLLKYGYVPYNIIMLKDKLSVAFRSQNADSILFYLADIGHYIADANVPLHTTVNYDGQMTNQKGLHALWESSVPDIEVGQYELNGHHKAEYLDHPEEAIWNALRRAHLLLTDVFGKEKELSRQFTEATKFVVQKRNGRDVKTYSPEFVKAYAAALQPTINEQLQHSANLISDFWYSAWIDAGKPDLTSLLKQKFTRSDKRALRKEMKAFRNNKLIEKNFLMAIKLQQTSD